MQATARGSDYLSIYNEVLTTIIILSTPDQLREHAAFLLSSNHCRAATQALGASGGYSHKGKDTQAHCTHHDCKLLLEREKK
jgi:hypothetical protein